MGSLEPEKNLSLPSWWQKCDLKDLFIYESFEELLSWNLESKLITPKYITGPYFGAIVAILDFCDLEAGPKIRPLPLLYIYVLVIVV